MGACFVHQINTGVGEICSYKPAKKCISRANWIVTFFNGSHFWGGQLKSLAKGENVTRGLKKNCESQWYAVILLALSVEAHRVPLSTLVARNDARRARNGLSVINIDVIRTVQDHDDSFWPMLNQIIRVSKPFVDSIAACESRSTNLADCMLYFLGAARKVALLSAEEGDDPEFFQHVHNIIDKRFFQITTPLHQLALFLHPLCRKLAVLDRDGFMLCDMKCTTLEIAKEKWNWSQLECHIRKNGLGPG